MLWICFSVLLSYNKSFYCSFSHFLWSCVVLLCTWLLHFHKSYCAEMEKFHSNGKQIYPKMTCCIVYFSAFTFFLQTSSALNRSFTKYVLFSLKSIRSFHLQQLKYAFCIKASALTCETIYFRNISHLPVTSDQIKCFERLFSAAFC